MTAAGRPPRKRTLARELALQYLFQWDVLGPNFDPSLPLAQCCSDELVPLCDDPEVAVFARKLIDGVRQHQPTIDDAINDTARNWTLSRMVGIDRAILRMATFELGYCDDIPPRVSINEAIELAKKYSTDRSSAFVNGVLDRILRRFSEHPPGAPDAQGNEGAGRRSESGSGRHVPTPG